MVPRELFAVSLLGYTVVTCIAFPSQFLQIKGPEDEEERNHTSREGENRAAAAAAVLRSVSLPSSCRVLVITNHLDSFASALSRRLPEKKMFVLKAVLENISLPLTSLPNVLRQGRKVRRKERGCVSVVVASDSFHFLASFGEWTVRERLLVWDTRLIVMTRLRIQRAQVLCSSFPWTFSLTNCIFLLPEFNGREERWFAYSHLPFSLPRNQFRLTASWSTSTHLRVHPGLQLFPDKYSNFNGAKVNVTALPYKPYWTAETVGGEAELVVYSGSDRLMLEAIAYALNFTINVLPVTTWDEVVGLVVRRVSWVASVVHLMLPQRVELFDFTTTYEHSINLAFAKAKPSLRPRWQSLYYPLTTEVWSCVLGALLLTPPFVYLVSHVRRSVEGARLPVGEATMAVAAALLGQNISFLKASIHTSSRILMASWLFFSLIVTTAYTGNLIASLALPKSPQRPETLEHLINAVDRITMPSYGSAYLDFLKSSESESFRAWGKMMEVGVSVVNGLQRATKQRQAHVDGRRYLEQQIAEHFTQSDGSTQLYVGREGLLPGLNAWPIPHDAPYKPSFDRVLWAVQEAGLYNKWMADMLSLARREGRQKRDQQLLQEGKAPSNEPKAGRRQPLTLKHLQGPMFLIILGWIMSSVAFIIENLARVCF